MTENIMKKFFNIISCLLAGLFALEGCEDRILDLKPHDRFSEADVWASIESANEYLNECYSGMATLAIYSGGLENAENLEAGLTDQGVVRGNQGNWAFQQGDITPSEPGTCNIWSESYNTIRNCCIFLENIHRVPGITDAQIASLSAQARFIRAYRYMDLINYYSWWEGEKNGVPLILKSFKPGDDMKIDRANYDDIVDFIVKEMDECEQVLPVEWPDDEWGRITKGACRAVKSRILLYKASPRHNPEHNDTEWNAAAKAAKAVIDMDCYRLVEIDHSVPATESWKEYKNIFLHINEEQILCQPVIMGPDYMYNRFEARHAPNGYDGEGACCPTLEMVDTYQTAEGKPIKDADGNDINGYSDQDPFSGREMRFYATIVYNGRDFRGRKVENFMPDPDRPSDKVVAGKDSRHPSALRYKQTSETGFWLYKFMNEDVPLTGITNTPVLLIRYAEFFLNYAEAEFELGNESEARKYTNIIRTRAGLPPLGNNVTGLELREAVRHERTVELAYEKSHRFCDERRWEILPETCRTLWRFECFKDNDGHIRYVRDRTKSLSRFYNEKLYSFPIPAWEMEKSVWLNQNPGYPRM